MTIGLSAKGNCLFTLDALETAQLKRLVCLEHLSVRRTIWQNSVGTVAVDALGMGLAAFGLLGPLLPAFIHVTSEMTFILNPARLLSRDSRTSKRAEV